MGIAFLFGTDGLLLGLTLAHRRISRPEASRDDRNPTAPANPDVSAVIACYNGSEVIGETIEHLAPPHPTREQHRGRLGLLHGRHRLGRSQLRGDGGRREPLQSKQGTEHQPGRPAHNDTEYTLVVDDDTHVGSERLPVELLGPGYAAVAFE